MGQEDSQQNWIVDGAVKLTFFSADLQHEKLLVRTARSQTTGSGFKIATLLELCQLKATVTASLQNPGTGLTSSFWSATTSSAWPNGKMLSTGPD